MPKARPCAIIGESTPNNILVAAWLKASNPKTGRYSWFCNSSAANDFSTFRTTGNTQGFPSDVR